MDVDFPGPPGVGQNARARSARAFCAVYRVRRDVGQNRRINARAFVIPMSRLIWGTSKYQGIPMEFLDICIPQGVGQGFPPLA